MPIQNTAMGQEPHQKDEFKARPSEPRTAEELLRAIIDGTSTVTGREFFRSLVKHVAMALRVRNSFVAECLPDNRARSLAHWTNDDFGPDFEYDLPGTPCMEVVTGRTCKYEQNLSAQFPDNAHIRKAGLESYVGVPLRDSTQRVIGHLVVTDDQPWHQDPFALSVLETFAARAGVELEREQARHQLEVALERRHTLLEINNAIITCLTREELLRTTHAALQRALAFDLVTILLHDPETDGLRICAIEGNFRSKHFAVGLVLDRKTSLSGEAFESRRTIVRGDLLAEARHPTERAAASEELRSICAAPLIAQDRSIGVMVLASRRTNQYSNDDALFAQEVANQVALAVANTQAFEDLQRLRDELAARKIAELEQQQRHMSDQLQQTSQALDASEERFRDLFDEAPIAYVHEGLDSRFIRANRAAMRVLGIKPEEIEGTYGKSFVPDTPDAQRRLRKAFESIGRGTDTSGIVLELRRKDNGKPIWIQWWSKPDPSGTYTRTMFVDITDRVLMEQEKARLEAQNTYLREEISAEHNFTEIVGNSPKLRAVLQQVEQVARTDSTVLIYGETGTGKELVARAIHDRSSRKKRPLVKVNCGAISAGLVESELFGHIKGAFTGALANRDGRFKVADGGTIFLDEVGELPLETQVKLLRVLQEQEFEPIGSDKSIKVDVRIIAATNRNLEEAVQTGKFRSDLLYRLNVFPIHVPPLRERPGDVPMLVMFFAQTFAKKLGKKITQVSEESMQRLAGYAWPGNIRELQNIIERAIILTDGYVLTLDREFQPAAAAGPPVPVSSPASTTSSLAPPQAVGSSLKDAERRHIESVLSQVGWVIEGDRGAARILNLHPNTLRSRMKKLSIERPSG